MFRPRIQIHRSASKASSSSFTRNLVSASRQTSWNQRNSERQTSRRRNHGFSPELGLRRDLPPDSSSTTGGSSEPPPRNSGNGGEPEVSDREWDIRTGRAIDILMDSLPEFFNVGLLTSINKSTGEPEPTSSIHIPAVNANPLGYRRRNEDMESIYSPKIQLSYTPPVELPAPFPKTLRIEGLPLYIASSAFVRHTLNALYSNLSVVLHKVSLNTPKSSHPSHQEESSSFPPDNTVYRKNREKSLFVGLRVTGTSRVSGSLGEWEVHCTYGFSPATGLIYRHTINSIEPAPHQTVYDALRASLGGVFGHGYRVPGASDRSEGHGSATSFSGQLEAQRVEAVNRAEQSPN
ncbi:hypothetical protein L218DRAFT_870659 [Marasmius fiardii PR-910]|nr:hypothetical protein L218DRAFT_870659 [Marasmius fiardii PR-910]